MRDTVLRGQQLNEGDKVVAFYGSANRDEDVFVEPDRFDVGRSPNRTWPSAGEDRTSA